MPNSGNSRNRAGGCQKSYWPTRLAPIGARHLRKLALPNRNARRSCDATSSFRE